jgi:hypothetical protein
LFVVAPSDGPQNGEAETLRNKGFARSMIGHFRLLAERFACLDPDSGQPYRYQGKLPDE